VESITDSRAFGQGETRRFLLLERKVDVPAIRSEDLLIAE